MLTALGLPQGLIPDAQTMVSEAATNALDHARAPGGEDRGATELWVYRAGPHLVCGVYDPVPERPLPVHADPAASQILAERGRGLTIIHELSGGRWGSHLTRGQLGDHRPGKVIWFRCGPAGAPARDLPVDPHAMASLLQERLRRRRIVRTVLSSRPELAVLSVCRGLDVWCSEGRFRLRDAVPEQSAVRPGYELAAVVEHVVRRYEELAALR